MKFLFLVSLTAALLMTSHAASAQTKPERFFDPTVFTPPSRTPLAGPRPLLRYLITALELPEQQVIAVQKVLKINPFPTPTLEELTLRLQPVLTDNQFDRLLSLRDDATISTSIIYLAARH